MLGLNAKMLVFILRLCSILTVVNNIASHLPCQLMKVLPPILCQSFPSPDNLLSQSQSISQTSTSFFLAGVRHWCPCSFASFWAGRIRAFSTDCRGAYLLLQVLWRLAMLLTKAHTVLFILHSYTRSDVVKCNIKIAVNQTNDWSLLFSHVRSTASSSHLQAY